jgi:hypothetical protein
MKKVRCDCCGKMVNIDATKLDGSSAIRICNKCSK